MQNLKCRVEPDHENLKVELIAKEGKSVVLIILMFLRVSQVKKANGMERNLSRFLLYVVFEL